MESVIGSCETYFRPITYEVTDGTYYYGRGAFKTLSKSISNQTQIVLNCKGDNLVFEGTKLDDQMFSCADKNWSIYAAKNPHSWCHNIHNSSTFLFATQNPRNESHILAEFCYNIDQLSLKTFVYKKTDLRSYNSDKLNNVGENLWIFKTTTLSQLSDGGLQEVLSEVAKTDEWLYMANYEVSLIVQDDELIKYFKGYEDLFNVIWWRPLRLGNWKHFQNALTHYDQHNGYELYVGTSGVAQYPTDNKCIKVKNLELKFYFQNETVPAYIWTFLKSNDESHKDFVIVGYNSPFAEYFTTKEIIFCPDICGEIPWLKEVSSTFRYAYGGIVFCCSTDFLRQTHYLQGFPMDILPSQDTTTIAATETLQSFATDINF